jgi:hypothetical protein
MALQTEIDSFGLKNEGNLMRENSPEGKFSLTAW